MMYGNLCFDYSAVLILILLIISSVFRKMLKGKADKCFFGLILIVFLTALFDIWAVVLDSMPEAGMFLKYFVNTGYIFIHNINLPYYLLYLAVLTDTMHIVKKKYLIAVVAFIPIIITLAIIIANIWTGDIFYFDENGCYTRGRYIIVLYICAMIYMIYGLAYIIYFRKLLKRRVLVSLYLVYVAVAVTVAVQYFYPDCLMEMLGLAISVMFVSLMVHRPEDTLDVVTGLYNLTSYMYDMKRCIANNKNIRIIMINISNYPTVRNLLGYNNNLVVMEMVANRINGIIKTARLDADLYYLERGKFRVVIDKTGFDKIENTAALINNVMKEKFVINQMAVNLVTQICVINCPEDIHDVDALMAFGDVLNTIPYMGNVRKASEILKGINYDVMQDIDDIIEEALANNGFSVYYQPIYSVKDNRFSSAEALLRLKSEKYGFISPDIFIPAAEKSGMIHKIGDFVLDEVCKFISSDDYKTLKLDYIEINLSVVQCMQADLVERIINTINLYNVKPEQINLEITETAASVSQQAMHDNIHALTQAGIKFSLDDFGTGYSNMQRVATLPLDIVKLDRSFTELKDNPKLARVLKHTINMIKDMDMKIVVEGIETKEMVDNFSRLECEYIQGFYFSRPVPKDEFIKFIHEAL